MASIKATKKLPGLKATEVGGRVLIDFESLVKALQIEPPNDADKPLTVTIKRAQELSGLGRTTLHRMVVRGREDSAAA
jgi:hypothetical protein